MPDNDLLTEKNNVFYNSRKRVASNERLVPRADQNYDRSLRAATACIGVCNSFVRTAKCRLQTINSGISGEPIQVTCRLKPDNRRNRLKNCADTYPYFHKIS